MSSKLTFTNGKIHDVTVRPLSKFLDERGWLAELFRSDDLAPALMPAMAYVSMTNPGIARGPHEHLHQSDLFCFFGPANFKIYLWDHRPDSPSRGIKQVAYGGEDSPLLVIVPPGVVHAYRNVSTVAGLVFNAPNRLYAGEGRREVVDEIRYEDAVENSFLLD